MTDNIINKSDLLQFTGTNHWYIHPLSKVRYTDGVRYIAQNAEAYWLIDAIVFSQHEKAIAAEEFQLWKLKVDLSNSTGLLVCEDGNGIIVYSQTIEYTDFPLDEIKFYLTNHVLLLPSEY